MALYSPDEARQQLGELIEAALRGEDVIIAQDNDHMVRLVPAQQIKHARKAGSAKGSIIISADFDAPLADFEEYMP